MSLAYGGYIPVAKSMGYKLAGEFGPAEVTPTQGAGNAKLADSKLVEIRNFPETETQALVALIRQNAEKLGLKLSK